MGDVTVVLHAPAGPHPAGALVAVGIEVRNASSQPIWIVGVVDGSEQAIRYPHYLPQVLRAGEVIAHPPPPEDPLVSPLRLADFRRLSPGEGFDPTRPEGGAAFLPISTFTTFRPLQAGRYAFRLTLSTESGTPEEWLGRFGQDETKAAVVERIALVPRLTVQSNVLEVDVG